MVTGNVVHAKEEVSDGIFDFKEPMQMDDMVEKPTIKLNGVKARVDRVHVDGLNRTKDDIIRNTVDDLFQATNFEDVITRAHKVRTALDSMGCFKNVGVFIDVSSGPGSTPEGLEVTFLVNELSRVVGGVNTTVSENEGNVVVGMKFPNVAGRGERIAAEYSFGHRSTSNFMVTAIKPYPNHAYIPVLSASVYQQNQQYPWSGYKLLDRGVLFDIAFRTSPSTKHNIQWEGQVRETSVLNKNTSFKVRESSGPQMKSVVRHIVSVDHRDEAIFPTRGTWVQFTSELAGLGGGVANIKTELQAQANREIAPNVIAQWSWSGGVLHDMYGTELPDRFFLGGPTNLRAFGQRGVGPRADGLAIGGTVFWASGLHLYTPLPFRPGKGGLGEHFRTHFFVNAGCLAHPEESGETHVEALKEARVSCGAGVCVRLGGVARLELNYCVPLRARAADAPAPGIQFGVAANFL